MIDKIKNIFSRKKTPQELHREATGRKLTESLKAPEQVIIPMKMHEGRECDCLVKAGDYVKIGQIIGASCDPNAVPVHSTVSGIVKAVEKMNIGYDIDVLCAVIDNDGKNYQASVYYMDIINAYERMGDFMINVSQDLERGFITK